MSEEYIISKKADIVGIANAIRSKNGNSDGIALDSMASLIEGIKTNGMDENILSLFGATDYEIVESKGLDNIYFPISNVLTSSDDIKLFIAIYNSYLTGVSLTMPEATTGIYLLDLIFMLNVNGLKRSFLCRTSPDDGSIECSGGKGNCLTFSMYGNNYIKNLIEIGSTINGKVSNYYTSQPYTALIIYNKSGE